RPARARPRRRRLRLRDRAPAGGSAAGPSRRPRDRGRARPRRAGGGARCDRREAGPPQRHAARPGGLGGDGLATARRRLRIAAAGALFGGLGRPELGPGLALSNLRRYFGAVPGTRDLIGPILLAAVVAVATFGGRGLVRAVSGLPDGLAITAAAAIVGLWLASSVSPDVVVVPIGLLALAVTGGAARAEATA